jgi:hypothetical protein
LAKPWRAHFEERLAWSSQHQFQRNSGALALVAIP